MKRHLRLGEHPVSDINHMAYHPKAHIIRYSLADVSSIRVRVVCKSLDFIFVMLTPNLM
jgi:hypothetical protein